MPDKTNYRLKPGILVHFFGEAEYYSHNIPDEVAERYIRENPQNINDFIEYPAQKTKRGRPKKEIKKDASLHIRLTSKAYSELDYLAYLLDKTKTDVVEDALRYYYNAKKYEI